jgi:hypothetical protein
MSIWTKEVQPKSLTKIQRKAVATNRGWEDSVTGEILIAIQRLAEKAGQANIVSVLFDQAAYEQDDALQVVVRYNEKVNVTAGATLQVSWSGVSGNFAATALAQTAVSEVVFAATVPAEAGNLSLAAQSVVGTVKDSNDGTTDSEVAISAPIAAAAGSKVVA